MEAVAVIPQQIISGELFREVVTVEIIVLLVLFYQFFMLHFHVYSSLKSISH